ncbi:MAG: GAF domain-containing protein, partial [Chloroflexota bacterium]
ADLLGSSKSNLLQQPLQRFIAADNQGSFAAHLAQILETKTRQVCELKLVKADGQPIEVRLESSPASHVAGQPGHYLTAISLISEQEQTEKMLAQRNRELELLNLAGQTFISSLDMDEILTTVLEGVRHLLDVVACSVWLVDPNTQELVCRQVTAPQNEIVLGWRLAPGQGLAGWVVQHGEALCVPDTRTETRHFKGIDEQTGLNLRSILTVPLRTKQAIIGVFQVVDKAIDRFDLTDLRLVGALAATAAIAIENARLYERALHDAETKAMLLNEVNHRVRNNLGIIIGLLYLEQVHLDEQARAVGQSLMEDVANRVQGLATVHDLLSASEWSPLPLTRLAKQIVWACLQTLAAKRQITVSVADSPIEVNPNQAHSLALVINELATNTVKYAWPNQGKGEISIYVGYDEDMIRFEFRDNGQGYPEDVLNQERHNIGFELIRNIVRRGLKGELTLQNSGGAVTTIRFKTGS